MRLFFVVSVFAASLASAAPHDIDSRACASCHREIAVSYAETGMGRSFSLPASLPDSAAEGTYHHDRSDTHFAMRRRDGQLYQRRWQLNPQGAEINVEELRVDYVMGSGHHARSFLHRTPRGTLLELPLGWYAEGGGQWAMSPGSDTAHPRTRRFLSYRCLSCHNANPRIPTGHDAPGADPIFTGELPAGIDCQRCHGPGSDHVRATGAAARRATIVNPARLSPQRRMEVCLQCHLETTSGRIPSAIVRFDRGPYSFLPGQPLSDFLLAFDHAPGTGHDDKFEVVGSAYRLRQSACFLRSQGQLTCDTCHNPHRAPRGAAAVQHYAAACQKCHPSLAAQTAANRHPRGENCAGCHMPQRRVDDTPGIVMTDHRIQRGPLPPGLTAPFREHPPEEYRGPVISYYTPDDPLYTAVAQVGLKNNLAAGLPQLKQQLAQQKPQHPEFYLILADGLLASGQRAEAIAAYEQALRLNPRSPRALRLLAAADPARAANLLNQALALDPRDPVTWFQLGQLQSSAEKIRQAITLDPSLPDQHRGLAEVLLRSGQHPAAQAAIQEALRVDPYDAAAWNLQARLALESNAIPAAMVSFVKATQLAPRQATYFYDHALALARTNQFDEAIRQVTTAINLNPDLPAAHELLGGLHETRGDPASAIREYQRAISLQPDSPRVHLRLGLLLAAQGQPSLARQHLQKAAANAAFRGPANEALRKLN